MVVFDAESYLEHYGTLRKSGRYPWGSGGNNAEQNHRDFLGYVATLRQEGMSEAEIARGFDMSTTQLRALKSIAKNETRQADIAFAQRLKDKGMSNVAIGEKMGLNESSVRSLLSTGEKYKKDVLTSTSDMLKEQVAEKGYIDIGTGVENYIGVSSTRLNTAVAMLKEQGYTVHYVKIDQLGTKNQTTIKVLAGPDTPYSEVYRNRFGIRQIQEYSEDGGRTFLGMQTPLSISSKRVGVTYGDEGGADLDGLIYVRPGVADVSLGGSRYAQVRIAVNGTHYIKGMAMYKDDLPDGVDLMFNTNKKDTGNKLDALKSMKDDADNPFGAVVRQHLDPKTGKPISAMNIVNEEGNWDQWSRNMSTQMLSKQSTVLAKQQLDMTYERKKQEFEEISALTNPVVRQKLLDAFADSTDSSAVHLKAAALPRQRSQVLLPMNSMKDTEVYAPNFRDGERVALIRYPHGGTFEIPELTVNNRNPAAKKAMGQAKDAIGINSEVAKRLSGADFDGDAVLVIPNDRGAVKSTPALQQLKGFDPQQAYPAYEGMPKMSPRTKQIQMGVVSNLITDMTIRGASPSELARAVKHSMVVIDAEKHNLNYKQSALDNGIAQLKAKYQVYEGSEGSGASTLISRATSELRVPERVARKAAEGGPVDKATGKKMYTPTGRSYVDPKTGKEVVRTTSTVKLAETDNAHTLSSGTPIEKIYANHSNRLKDLANQARKESANTKYTSYSPSAKEAYSEQVKTLNSKLTLAERNRPLERQAQLLGNAIVAAKKDSNPNMDGADLKKIKSQALDEARNRTGAKKTRIVITPDEWKAIQAGAISPSKLKSILMDADLDVVKKLATPKSSVLMSSTKVRRAESMLKSGYTQAEVADALGVSLTTLKDGIGG